VVTELHPLLARQLRRLGLCAEEPPTLDGWRALLDRISSTYQEQDEERYLVERAFTVSSRELETLNAQLRQRSEEALTIQEAALDTMRDGFIVTNVEGVIMAQNRKFAELLPIPAEVGPHAADRLAYLVHQVRDPEAFKARARYLMEHRDVAETDEFALLDGRIIERFLAPVRGRDGTTVGCMAVFRDVTQARRSGEALRRAHQFLDSIIENIPDVVFVKDADQLRYLRFNRAGEELLGVSRDDLLGRSDHELFPPEQADLFVAKDREVLEAGDVLDIPEEIIPTPRGERRLHTKKLTIRDERGRPLFLLGISRDVTEEIRARDALAQAKRAAEQASRAKTQFLSNMSHELRTPLNAIVGFARVLADAPARLDAASRQYVDYIRRAGEHMASLVNDLLDLRKVEDGKAALEIGEYALGGIVEAAMRMVGPLVLERGHQVETAVEVEQARCDPRAMLQVLVNLLSNAAKYTPPGGRIRLASTTTPEDVRIEVTDTGIGIATEDLPHLFEYFMQVGAKHVHHMQGSGVGLALTKQLVERMGGSIEVESLPQHGSTFRVRLPRRAT
jgi:PAS domain S-box-containing protein